MQVQIIRNYAGKRPPPRRHIYNNCETELVQLPKRMDPTFTFEMRRYITESVHMYNNHAYTGVSSETISQTKQHQQRQQHQQNGA